MPPCKDAQAALDDENDGLTLEVAGVFVADDASKAISDKRKRAAAAKHAQTLVVVAPLRQRREFKRALRRRDAELRGRL